MSYRELFVSQPLIFAGLQRSYQEAKYIIFGVPFDTTSTYRTGARFAPVAIREASQYLEPFSVRAGVDIQDVRFHDLGDLHVTGEVNETLKRLELVSKEIIEEKKSPICIGGEHTVTLGNVKGINDTFAVVSFDAHLDLRDKYMNRTVSHTTFMRRISETIGPENILEIGVRAVCKEELNYAKDQDLQFLTVQQIRKYGLEKTMKIVSDFVSHHKNIYLTIDMDVLDPAFAPAVQNPEPDGLSISMFFDIVCGLCDHRIIAFDIVEVCPHYDNGLTAIQTAKTLFEVLCHLDRK